MHYPPGGHKGKQMLVQPDVFQQDLLYTLKDILPFCVSPGPLHLPFSHLKSTMAKTRSNEQCLGHRNRKRKEKKKAEGEIHNNKRLESNTC